MEEKGISHKQVMEELKKASMEDLHFKDGRILGSMCTKPLSITEEAHSIFLEANLGNPGLYPGTKRLEEEVIRMLSLLLHGKNLPGFMVEGGTEANITALWMARNFTKKKEVIFSKNAHFSLFKACDLLNMKPVEVKTDSAYRMDVEEAEEKISDKTAAVFAVAGSTELGAIDPIESLSELCCEKVFLHVDAAFGGFVIPFLEDLGYKMPPFDFRLKGVSSITIDGHKMGMATIPSSALLFREAKYMKKISVESPYLTSIYHTSILGTRCSAGVASTYAAMRFLGREGYRRIVKKCMDTTHYLAREIKGMGLNLVMEPIMNILGVHLANPEAVHDKLDELGWKTSLGRNPRCLRLVVMPHISMRSAQCLVRDLEAVCKKLGEI